MLFCPGWVCCWPSMTEWHWGNLLGLWLSCWHSLIVKFQVNLWQNFYSCMAYGRGCGQNPIQKHMLLSLAATWGTSMIQDFEIDCCSLPLLQHAHYHSCNMPITTPATCPLPLLQQSVWTYNFNRVIIVIACTIRVASGAGIKLVGAPQPKSIDRHPPYFQYMLTD